MKFKDCNSLANGRQFSELPWRLKEYLSVDGNQDFNKGAKEPLQKRPAVFWDSLNEYNLE